jgi:hypothetical protein
MPSPLRVSLVNFHCRAPSTQDKTNREQCGGLDVSEIPGSQSLDRLKPSDGQSRHVDEREGLAGQGCAKASEPTGSHTLQASWIVLRSTGAPFRRRGRTIQIQEPTETHSPALFELAEKSDW